MDANERLHRDWLGMAQPEGLVVTLAALKEAEANISWPITERQAALRELTHQGRVVDLLAFFREVLDWSDDFLVDRSAMPAHLSITIEEGDRLVPSYALKSADDDSAFVLVVTETREGTDLDAAYDERRWTASAHQRFERLLRETGLGVGLLTNGRDFRLVYAPKGESAGWVTFRLGEMLSVDGRPLLGAFHMLLNERRLLTLPEDRRLLALLQKSRAYQSTVSTALREQVLGALRTLLQGFQAADALAAGKLLQPYRGEAMHEVYLGLVTTLMRMVFVLFAEERELLPMGHDLYAASYSLTKLYAQLTQDRGEHGEGLDARYGAWARVLTLFRVLHDGLQTADGLRLPKREGKLFNPDEFPFLEGRPRGSCRQAGERLTVPRVSDGVVFRVLDQLLMLGGERLQYKGLDVEQIGSVYEGLMGFELEYAEGDSLCLSPDHVVINIEKLLKLPGAERLKQLKSEANLDLKDKAASEVKGATTVQGLQVGLAKRASKSQPGLLPRGTLFLQPGEERRRSGSHYTPRALTQPIVETTLRPVLERLSGSTQAPYALTPDQILSLKICDPAMGSGAFLVEVCRQLADHLVAAWRRTGTMPELPPDEDPVLRARRLVAQKCIYGVDKNPLAVDLARLSVWLVTFAREHPFTFVDHSLRCGDSLVGLSREQIFSFGLEPSKAHKLGQFRNLLYTEIRKAEQLRAEIHAIGDPPNNERLIELWRETNETLARVRLIGDLVVASSFAEESNKTRSKALESLVQKVYKWLVHREFETELCGMAAGLRETARPLEPFHWEVEFPEVFGSENPGFDCFIGNPPFMGGTKSSERLGRSYLAHIVAATPGTTGNLDLAAYFLRRLATLVRIRGHIGVITTNSVMSGDSYRFGLQFMHERGTSLFVEPNSRQWPGGSANVAFVEIFLARGTDVPSIATATPKELPSRKNISCRGCDVMGEGFVLSSEEWQLWKIKHPESIPVVQPYLGGSEFNSSPVCGPERFIINFGEMPLEEAEKYSAAFSRVAQMVRPARASVAQRDRRELWWLYATRAPRVYAYLREHGKCLAVSQLSKHLAFSFVGTGVVLSHTLILFLLHQHADLSVLQSSIHTSWAQSHGSSMRMDTRYTSAACFETFPFPEDRFMRGGVEAIGKEYYEFRASLMADEATRFKLMAGLPPEGLTKTYNKFHDPDCHLPGIVRLRELHAQMDRAVLDAYGWQDIQPVYDFREQLDESIRLTWAEETRDEVLARLLELNRVMAEQEAAEAKKAEVPKKAKATSKPEAPASEGEAPKKGRGGRKKKDEATLALPGSDDGEAG